MPDDVRHGFLHDAVGVRRHDLIELERLRKIDGKLGQKTQAALIAFQKKSNLRSNGDADEATLKELEAQVAALPTSAPAPAVEPEPVVAMKPDAEVKSETADLLFPI